LLLSPRETSISVQKLFVTFAVLFALLLPSAVRAQTPEDPSPHDGAGSNAAPLPQSEAELARGLPILRIVVTGNRRITPEDVVTYLRERSGQEFSPEVLTQDVVRERPSVNAVTFEGNTEIEKDDLRDGVELKANTILSPPAIRRSIQKIRDMYAEKGFFLAEVESETVPQKNNEVEVKFKIREQGQVSVKRVTFIGNESIPTDELRSLMFIGNPGIFAFGSGGPFRQDAFERDIAVISAMYYDRGFLAVTVSTPRVMLTPDRTGIEIAITIEEGPRYKIRQLRVFERGEGGKEIDPIGGRRNLRMMVRAKTGDYFNRAALLEDLQAIRTMYRDHGYANVDANPQTQLDPATNEVDVIVPVDRGPLVHFERIEMRGNAKTRDKVIRRELEVFEGGLFHETKLERSKRRVTALGYFERVDVSMEQGSAPDKMNVYIEVAERPTGTFQVGAGFSSVENFIATAQIQQANLFGNGQSLSLQGQFSSLRQLVNIHFFEPYFLDSKFNASIDLYDQQRYYRDFAQASVGGGLTFGYPLIEPELYASVTYTGEMDTVSTDRQPPLLGTSSQISVFQRLPLANLFNDGFTSSIRPGLTYDSRDNRLFPTSGKYLGSENEFVRHKFTGRFYYPLFWGFVAKLNTEFGHVTSPSNKGVPIFARFYLGGIYDLRGFEFRSVGPRLPLTRSTDPNSDPIPNGANIGGNLQYFQNLELEFPIVESVGLKGVLFTDAGNAWNLEQNYCKAAQGVINEETSPCFRGLSSIRNLRTSYGFGFRWFSPLGPLRFEWGYPFKPLSYEQASQFEFTIGNFF
jgi:outer membrane protein insertion porin family